MNNTYTNKEKNGKQPNQGPKTSGGNGMPKTWGTIQTNSYHGNIKTPESESNKGGR